MPINFWLSPRKLKNYFSSTVSSCGAQIYTGGSTYTDVEPVEAAAANVEEVVLPAPANDDFITQTVYGFLDFTTTIANTVMVFSPQSAPPGERERKIYTVVYKYIYSYIHCAVRTDTLYIDRGAIIERFFFCSVNRSTANKVNSDHLGS